MEKKREVIDQVLEQIADEKFEKIAEIKAEYKFHIKKAQTSEEVEDLEIERDVEITKVKKQFDDKKNQQLKEVKDKQKEDKDLEENKRKSIKKATKRMKRSLSRVASKIATPSKKYQPQVKVIHQDIGMADIDISNPSQSFSMNNNQRDLLSNVNKGVKT